MNMRFSGKDLLSILQSRDFSYLSVLRAGEVFEAALDKKEYAQEYFDYITEGIAKRNFNVLEKFNATLVYPGKQVSFFDASQVFKLHGYPKYAKALLKQRKELNAESENDFSLGIDFFTGKNGQKKNYLSAVRYFCYALCKDPRHNASKFMLGQSFFSEQEGLMRLPMIGEMILGGIDVVTNKSYFATKKERELFHHLLDYCCDEDVFAMFCVGSDFYYSGKGTHDNRIDQYFQAQHYHNSPTPMFFFHMGCDQASTMKNASNFVDACIFYEHAHRLDADLVVPPEFSTKKKQEGLRARRKETDQMMNNLLEINAKYGVPLGSAEREEERRQHDRMLADYQAAQKAHQIQLEIEEMMYDRGSLGRGKYSY